MNWIPTLPSCYLKDTEIGSTYSPSFNDTITINITIIDIDNRPPWFQPCTPFEITGMTGCVGEQSYTGSVYLNEQQVREYILKPAADMKYHHYYYLYF